MSAAFKFCVQKCFQNLNGESLSDHTRSHAEHICIIVQAGIFCAVCLRTDCRTDALHLVCRDAHADARSAQQNAGIRFAVLYFFADDLCDLRIITRCFIRSAVHKRDLPFFKICLHDLAQICCCVVTSDCDHNSSPPFTHGLLVLHLAAFLQFLRVLPIQDAAPLFCIAAPVSPAA